MAEMVKTGQKRLHWLGLRCTCSPKTGVFVTAMAQAGQGAAMPMNLKPQKKKMEAEIKQTSPKPAIRPDRAGRFPGKLCGRSFGMQSLRIPERGLAVADDANSFVRKEGRCRRCCCRACRRKPDYTLDPCFCQ
jgi:hypothetical protein